jgi:hypothetical protein
VKTPMEKTGGVRLAGKITVIPILRAGAGHGRGCPRDDARGRAWGTWASTAMRSRCSPSRI